MGFSVKEVMDAMGNAFSASESSASFYTGVHVQGEI